MRIGPHELPTRVLVAPMAGVTDQPFRRLCRRLGAAYTVGEMASADPRLWRSAKTLRRLDLAGEPAPRAVQLTGADADVLADAARRCVERGAQIIDLNMGCPAKKVCNKACGSALLRDEWLVAQILAAVVRAVPVPVTLKMRTGWDPTQRNAVRIAGIAQDSGIQMLVVHGRTRACGYGGAAEYATIAAVKRAVSIPVVANGDIDCAAKARAVLAATGADAVMIGRAALRAPWLPGQVDASLRSGAPPTPPTVARLRPLLLEHLDEHHAWHGDPTGVRSARRLLLGYTGSLPNAAAFRARLALIDTATAQRNALDELLAELEAQTDVWPDPTPARSAVHPTPQPLLH